MDHIEKGLSYSVNLKHLVDLEMPSNHCLDKVNEKTSVEQRNYVLNIDKTLSKLEDAANRKETVDIHDVSGNIIIYFQSGIYQLFRSALYSHFSQYNIQGDDDLKVLK